MPAITEGTYQPQLATAGMPGSGTFHIHSGIFSPTCPEEHLALYLLSLFSFAFLVSYAGQQFGWSLKNKSCSFGGVGLEWEEEL